ncbi:hypothetical protein COT52_01355, partial [candidate division WWE3 bacterium CG08_land_8_20_14_0_20_43_13]
IAFIHGQARGILRRCIKFGPGGSGTRLHFEESRKRQKETYKPIFEALDNNDLKGMEVFL